MSWRSSRPEWPLRLCDDQQGQALADQIKRKKHARGIGASDTNFAGADLGSLVGLASCFLLVKEKDIGKLLGYSPNLCNTWKGLRLYIDKAYGCVPLHFRGIQTTKGGGHGRFLGRGYYGEEEEEEKDKRPVHPFDTIPTNPAVSYVFEAPGPFWIKAGGTRIRVMLPDGRFTLGQSFSAYDTEFHVYWDNTRQAMTCGGASASYCWPFVLSIPPWRAPRQPTLSPTTTITDTCQLLVDTIARLENDLLEQVVFPPFHQDWNCLKKVVCMGHWSTSKRVTR